MSAYTYKNGRLFCRHVALSQIAQRYGTPCYVYSADEIRARYRRVAKAFAPAQPLICYSVKANGNLSILRLLAQEGSGFDIVSQGELYRTLRAGAKANKVVFAGVGKTDEEIEAALRAKVFSFNVESGDELLRIDRIAGRLRLHPRVALRVNPDVDPKTHVYITTGKRENKFGVDLAKAKTILRQARTLRNAVPVGIHIHIGSQITQPKPYLDSLKRIRALFSEFPGGKPEILDLGGGFGISYQGGEGLDVEDLAKKILPSILDTGAKLILEPGRFIVASSGALLTRVIERKQSGSRSFLIVDAGMNDLIRPSLYSAYHRIWPIQKRGGKILADIVGPICESGDFFAKDRQLSSVKEGDLLAILDAGAYGFTMASHYNSRPNPPEVLVEGKRTRLIRKRETFQDLLRGER